MKIIVCVDEHFGIGKNNTIPWHLSADLKHFKETTMGKTICMGYNTLMSLPGSKPLPGRNNVILYDKDEKIEGCTVVHSKEQLLEYIYSLPQDDVYITGGASVYRLMLPYCDEVNLTVVEDIYDVDTYFPDLTKEPEWQKTYQSESYEENGIRYHYETHVNNNVKK